MKTRKLIMVGLALALCIILTYTPLGMIPLPIVSVTIAHIPIIVITLLEGLTMGVAVGLVFGILTLVKALTMAVGVLDPFFINPLVSVLPRILIAFTTYFSYKLFDKLNNNLGIAVGAAIGSLTNTIGCLSMIYFIYGNKLIQGEINASAKVFLASIFSSIVLIGICEAIASTIISFPIIKAAKKVFKSYED